MSAHGGGLQRRHAVAQLVIYIFRRDDGIVHNDTHHDDETEQAHHIGGDAKPRHHDKTASEGHRDADGHPEGDGRPQEQPEQDEDQQASLQQAAKQRAEAAFELQ